MKGLMYFFFFSFCVSTGEISPGCVSLLEGLKCWRVAKRHGKMEDRSE